MPEASTQTTHSDGWKPQHRHYWAQALNNVKLVHDDDDVRHPVSETSTQMKHVQRWELSIAAILGAGPQKPRLPSIRGYCRYG